MMNSKEILELLNSKHFKSLDNCARTALAANAKPVLLEENQLIFSKFEPADHVYAVASGEIAIEITSRDGRAYRVATLSKGDIFGELAALDGGPRTADARAAIASQILKIEKHIYLDLVRNNPQFAFRLLAEIIGIVRKTDSQIEKISFQTLKSRLIEFLLSQWKSDGNVKTEISMTQSQLAERLSATREKVNVNLQKIQRTGAITLKRGKIEISNIETLRSLRRTAGD